MSGHLALMVARDPSREDALGFLNALFGTFAAASMLVGCVMLFAVITGRAD